MGKILIVDDLSSVHEMLQAVFSNQGYESDCATSGKQALEMYKSGNYDLILTDIAMEPMDGLTLLENVKQINSSAIVIMMTGYASKESAIASVKHGAFDFIEKPFRIEQLMRILKKAEKRLHTSSTHTSPEETAENEETENDSTTETVSASPKSAQILRDANLIDDATFTDWPTLNQYLQDRKRHYLKALLSYASGDTVKAAKIAQVSRREFLDID